jgi:hypothetical protein
VTHIVFQTLASTAIASVVARPLGINSSTGALMGLSTAISGIAVSKLYPEDKKKEVSPGELLLIFAFGGVVAKVGQMGVAYFGGVLSQPYACSFLQALTITIYSADPNAGLTPSVAAIAAYAQGLKPEVGVIIGSIMTISSFVLGSLSSKSGTWKIENLKEETINTGLAVTHVKVAQFVAHCLGRTVSFPEAFFLGKISFRLSAVIGEKIHKLIT